jgi:flagellar biosynthetic protein FliO
MKYPGNILFFLLIVLMQTYVRGAGEDIGNFDIGKVRDAVYSSDSGLGETIEPAVQEEKLASVIIRITVYLAIIIAAILVTAWFIRKKGIKATRAGGGGAMDVIESMTMGPNRSLTMVRVMDEIYLLSQTANSITLLDKIGGQKAVDIIASSKGGGTMMQFKDAFNNFMGKMKKSS